MIYKSYSSLIKTESLFSWHKPGKGLLLFGDNEAYLSAFEKDVLYPGICEGQVSVLIAPGGVVSRLCAFLNPGDARIIDVVDFDGDSEYELYSAVAEALSQRPMALFLSFPDTQGELSQNDLKVIRRSIQQCLTWIDTEMTVRADETELSGMFYLDQPEKYIIKEQSGLMIQIEHIKNINYCVGYHYSSVPKELSDFTGLREIIPHQNFIVRISDHLSKHKELCKLLKSEGGSSIRWYKRILPCPRTLIDRTMVL